MVCWLHRPGTVHTHNVWMSVWYLGGRRGGSGFQPSIRAPRANSFNFFKSNSLPAEMGVEEGGMLSTTGGDGGGGSVVAARAAMAASLAPSSRITGPTMGVTTAARPITAAACVSRSIAAAAEPPSASRPITEPPQTFRRTWMYSPSGRCSHSSLVQPSSIMAAAAVSEMKSRERRAAVGRRRSMFWWWDEVECVESEWLNAWWRELGYLCRERGGGGEGSAQVKQAASWWGRGDGLGEREPGGRGRGIPRRWNYGNWKTPPIQVKT